MALNFFSRLKSFLAIIIREISFVHYVFIWETNIDIDPPSFPPPSFIKQFLTVVHIEKLNVFVGEILKVINFSIKATVIICFMNEGRGKEGGR